MMYLDISKTSDTGQYDVFISKLQKCSVEDGSLEDGVQPIEETTSTHLLLAFSCQMQRTYETKSSKGLHYSIF